MNAEGRQARARGLEYQLADDVNADAVSDLRRVAASLYLESMSSNIRLVVIGNHVEHWLNSVMVVEFDVRGPGVQKLLRSYLPNGLAARDAAVGRHPGKSAEPPIRDPVSEYQD
jgi:hypothetical protein